MAVELTATRETFVGTGVLSSYTPGFYATNSDQVKVYVDGALQSIGDDYTLDDLGDADGVTVEAVFPLNSVVFVKRTTPRTQEVDTQNNETILEEVLDAAFDKLTMIAQEQDGDLDRALKVPDGEEGFELPDAASRANLFLVFDALGNPILSQGTGADAGLRGDLGASTGGSLIGLLRGVAGAVIRSVADWFEDQRSIMDFIPLVERVKIRLRTTTADLAPYFDAAFAAMTNGGELHVPSGLFYVGRTVVSNRGITVRCSAGTLLKRYGNAGLGVDGSYRGMFYIAGLLDADFTIALNGATVDLNGEGPEDIGVAGRIANTYASFNVVAFPGLKGISGPANSLVYALRSTAIRVYGPGTIKNSGETAILFRNSGDTTVEDIHFDNLANYGVEYSWPANDGTVGMPMPADTGKHAVRRCRFTRINDYGLSSGNGVGIGGGGEPGFGAIRVFNFTDNVFEYCLRDIHVEFPVGGAWLELATIKGVRSYRAGQGSLGFIGIRRSVIEDVVIVDPGDAAQVALTYQKTLTEPSGGTYPESYFLILSTDFDDVLVDNFIGRDGRSGGVTQAADGVAIIGQVQFTSATANFQPGDVGKPISILGAGPAAGVVHTTTIATRINATTITLAKAPRATVAANANFAFGGGTRDGIIATDGQSVTFGNVSIEAGSQFGLPAEPAASAIRMAGIKRLAAFGGMTELRASANGTAHPTGLRMTVGTGWTGKLWRRAREMRVFGFADYEIGTYNLRATVIPVASASLLDRAIAPAAGINAYGAEEFMFPSGPSQALATPFLEMLHNASFEALGAFVGGEIITFRVRAYFMDGVTGPETTVTLAAPGTVSLTAKNLNTLNPDGAAVRIFGFSMKSSVAASTVTGKANLLGQ